MLGTIHQMWHKVTKQQSSVNTVPTCHIWLEANNVVVFQTSYLRTAIWTLSLPASRCWSPGSCGSHASPVLSGDWNLLWKLELPSMVNSLLPVFCNTKNPCMSILLVCLLPRPEKAEESGAFVLGLEFYPAANCASTWSWHQLKLPSIRFARLDNRMCSHFAGLLLCT